MNIAKCEECGLKFRKEDEYDENGNPKSPQCFTDACILCQGKRVQNGKCCLCGEILNEYEISNRNIAAACKSCWSKCETIPLPDIFSCPNCGHMLEQNKDNSCEFLCPICQKIRAVWSEPNGNRSFLFSESWRFGFWIPFS
jgi:hypothetical protein